MRAVSASQPSYTSGSAPAASTTTRKRAARRGGWTPTPEPSHSMYSAANEEWLPDSHSRTITPPTPAYEIASRWLKVADLRSSRSHATTPAQPSTNAASTAHPALPIISVGGDIGPNAHASRALRPASNAQMRRAADGSAP